MLFLLLQAVLDQIRTFVAEQDMSRLHAFLGLFYSDLTQTREIQLRFDSDIWTKNGGWSLCPLEDLGPFVDFLWRWVPFLSDVHLFFRQKNRMS